MKKYDSVIERLNLSLKPESVYTQDGIANGRLYDALTQLCARLDEMGRTSTALMDGDDLGDVILVLFEVIASHVGSSAPLFLDELWLLVTLNRARDTRVAQRSLLNSLNEVPVDQIHDILSRLTPDARQSLSEALWGFGMTSTANDLACGGDSN